MVIFGDHGAVHAWIKDPLHEKDLSWNLVAGVQWRTILPEKMRYHQLMLMLEGSSENYRACLYKQEVSVIFTVMCYNILGHTTDLFLWRMMIWLQRTLVSGHFEMPPNALNTWGLLLHMQTRQLNGHIRAAGKSLNNIFCISWDVGGGHILCSLPDSAAVQRHVDPDRSDLCAPHLTHLCSALVTTKLLMAILTWSFVPGGGKEGWFQVIWRVKTTLENITFPFRS